VSRVTDSIAAKNTMGEDFFGGWEQSDVELFERFAKPSVGILGKITDFMGVRTTTSLHPWAAHYDGQVLASVPIPDDSLRAEAIEYFALFDALERSPGDTFSMAEIGASYAPWTCAGAVVARRRGKAKLNLTAVEASSFLFPLISLHLSENDVDTSGIRLINGAIATERTTLFFPKVNNPGDNGGQISAENAGTDYLNRSVENEEVQAYLLEDLIPEGIVDLIHMDIQGFEYDVLAGAIDIANKRVRSIFVGTHSRKIEGQLLELFHGNGWKLSRERPTRFTYEAERKDVVGWTTRDGGQYWINSRFE
jgi:FkbM family methyltransferase